MAFKGIDFKALMDQTPEEREQRRLDSEARQRQDDLDSMSREIKDRSGRSTQRLSITVEEIQFLPQYANRTGVFVRGTNAQNERIGMLVAPLEREDYDTFVDRFRSIEPGSTLTADGLYEQRRWKDGQGQWRSNPEFHGLMPVSPPQLTLSQRLPEGVTHAASFFSSRQKAAAQSQGMGR